MKTVEQRGWRQLRNGETIRKGDRMWGVTGQWVDCNPTTEVTVDDTMKVIRRELELCPVCSQTPGIARDGLGVVPAEQGQYAVECACGWRSAWWNTRAKAVGDWNNVIGALHEATK